MLEHIERLKTLQGFELPALNAKPALPKLWRTIPAQVHGRVRRDFAVDRATTVSLPAVFPR